MAACSFAASTMLRISRPVAVSLAEYVNVGIFDHALARFVPCQKPPQTRLQSTFPIVPNMGKTPLELQVVKHKHFALYIFRKKKVAYCPGFFYFHCQLHRMVPGQTGFALRRVKRETRKH
jgi:hypothetical protein